MMAGLPAGVILAGGWSSRMGVDRKALIDLGGKPLLAHVIGRLRRQVSELLLSCEAPAADFELFGLPQVADIVPRHRGPLVGLCSALQYLADRGGGRGLVLCPCDAPFLPADLVHRLQGAARRGREDVVVASYLGELQPTFSLWQDHHLPVVREAVTEHGKGGLKYVLDSLPYVVAEWPVAEPPPFFNANTPADLRRAAAWLDEVAV